jgi:hypothetical protein
MRDTLGMVAVGMSEDLLQERRCALEFSLPHFIDFWPDRVIETSPHIVTSYLSAIMSRLARCFWLGLGDEVRPRIEAIAAWMEKRAPPDFVFGHNHSRSDIVVWEVRQSWWEILGLCKWLARDEPALDELSQALFAQWDYWHQMRPERHALDLSCRQVYMSHTLALALAARRPEFGAHMYGLVEDWEPQYAQAFRVRYGQWACVHLAHGGLRDGEYVRAGIHCVEQCAAETYPWGPSQEQLLWLKAIWFDTGLAATAEESVLREFDVTGDGQRPRFLPRRESFL